jgi:ATP-dependent Clp protease ATP-binding subunit ClpA
MKTCYSASCAPAREWPRRRSLRWGLPWRPREESEVLFAEALSSIGISLDAVRGETGGAFEMRIPDDRRIPFSPWAKQALEGALREAIRLGYNRITDEHILLGVLREENGTAGRLLGNLGVTPAALKEQLDQLRGQAA